MLRWRVESRLTSHCHRLIETTNEESVSDKFPLIKVSANKIMTNLKFKVFKTKMKDEEEAAASEMESCLMHTQRSCSSVPLPFFYVGIHKKIFLHVSSLLYVLPFVLKCSCAAAARRCFEFLWLQPCLQIITLECLCECRNSDTKSSSLVELK